MVALAGISIFLVRRSARARDAADEAADPALIRRHRQGGEALHMLGMRIAFPAREPDIIRGHIILQVGEGARLAGAEVVKATAVRMFCQKYRGRHCIFHVKKVAHLAAIGILRFVALEEGYRARLLNLMEIYCFVCH